jgi:hypothetical protein
VKQHDVLLSLGEPRWRSPPTCPRRWTRSDRSRLPWS